MPTAERGTVHELRTGSITWEVYSIMVHILDVHTAYLVG